ncbi:MAG: methyltransferase domain-containing protein [Microlunatus sp.]
MNTAGLGCVLDLLRCPRCRATMELSDRTLRCPERHTYDVAKQGYVNLTGAAQPAHADTPAMVAARAELLGSGRYAALTDALLGEIPERLGTVLDIGTGTGHYVSAVLNTRPGARALGLDISVAACRRAARAHPRLGVITADAWAELPIASDSVDLILSVFSPRNAPEFARMLRPGGTLITVTPTADHLVELRAAFGLLGVESGKEDRLAGSLERAGLAKHSRHQVTVRDPWSAEDAVRAVLMGPNAFHTTTAEAQSQAAALTWPQSVTVSCLVTRWYPLI